ncbi:hypothetical protein L2E82_20912 [Cichorium intybus]|uniref:Uncharacterized protein n=1 Tax=Cichorium intybus TaxID=13427 RepID=A0ACB9DUA7_CICIN|nr:hypothetical protein L2E82_20912 [Cichorium intybus]
MIYISVPLGKIMRKTIGRLIKRCPCGSIPGENPLAVRREPYDAPREYPSYIKKIIFPAFFSEEINLHAPNATVTSVLKIPSSQMRDCVCTKDSFFTNERLRLY